ncbi:NnrU family protein [Cohaesibacter marisflavi]|uniref:NnrU family protein n=1 Tax=Cohaesibacter marisflavi TaxID=655353 RepID=UPI0029C72E03|nr:NnrU family protein [Cohaesibacter marisflavi]
MTMLIFGVLLWAVVHLFPIFLPTARAGLLGRMGEGPYKGLFALLIILSLVLIVFGWRVAGEAGYIGDVYDEDWTRHLTHLLMLFSIILFGVAKAPTRIRRFIRNPMLTGMALWAIAHLLGNNDQRSLVLFGGMLLWSVVSIIGTNRRDGAYVPPEVGSWGREIRIILISVVVYAVLIVAHPYFTGMEAMDLSFLW